MNKIAHTGIVRQISSQTIVVEIQQKSACAGCHVRSLCQSSETKDKLITVNGTYQSIKVGDTVMLEGDIKQSEWAVVLAYVIPLVILVGVLCVAMQALSEGVASLLAFLSVALYYALLYVFKKPIAKRFSFVVKEIIN